MCVSVQQKLLLNCCLSLYLDRKREPLITKLENIIAHHRPSPMLARIILYCRLACNNAKIKQQLDYKIQLSTIIKNMSFSNRFNNVTKYLKTTKYKIIVSNDYNKVQQMLDASCLLMMITQITNGIVRVNQTKT